MAIVLRLSPIAHVQPTATIAHGMLKQQLVEGQVVPNVVELTTSFGLARHMNVGRFAQQML